MKEMERFVIGSRGIEAGRKEDNYQVECGNFHLVVDKITELGLRGLSCNVRLVFCFTRIKRRVIFGVRTEDCQQIIFLSREEKSLPGPPGLMMELGPPPSLHKGKVRGGTL